MQRNRKRIDHSGSTLDSLLAEDGILSEVETVAINRVIDWQRQQRMKAENDEGGGCK